jgi:hypothetical protein
MKRVALVLALVACHPAPLPPVPDVVVPDAATPALDAAPTPAQDASAPDAGPMDACLAACLNLKALGCLGGDVATCADVCRKVQLAGLTDLKPGCLADAGSRQAARACGSVKCP